MKFVIYGENHWYINNSEQYYHLDNRWRKMDENSDFFFPCSKFKLTN